MMRTENMTYEQSREYVIDQAKDAYSKDKITFKRLESDINALLHDKTPVDGHGFPLYCDPRLF